MSGAPPPAGLQAERTALAHGRTQLVALGAAALIVRQSSGAAEVVVSTVIVLSAVLLVSWATWQRSRHLRHDTTSPVAAKRTATTLVVAAVALQVAGVIVVL